MPPTNESIEPVSGNSSDGSVYTIQTVFSDPNGADDVRDAALRVGDLNREAIYVYYNKRVGKLYLLDESGDTYVGGYAPGSPHLIEHRRGGLDCSLTTVQTMANRVIIRWALRPSASFLGAHNLFQIVRDESGVQSALQQTGSWTVSARADGNLPPSNVSVSPVSGTSRVDAVQFIQTVFQDDDGALNLHGVGLMAGESNSAALRTYYDVRSGKLFVLNDAGDLFEGGYDPGSPNMIINSRGSLDCSLTTVQAVGNRLIVTWALIPSASFVGAHNLYQIVRDEVEFPNPERTGSWLIHN